MSDVTEWGTWKYMTRHLAVVPFTKGTPVYTDGMLSMLYYKSKELGRLENTFCGDNPSHDQFIRMFEETKKVTQVLCEITDQGTPDERIIPVGYSWVEIPKGEDGARAAMCGFAFIRRSRHMVNLGRLGIYYWMDGLKIDVLHGVMLLSNQVAADYALKLGFKQTAIVPDFHFYQGKLVAARAMLLRKYDFMADFEPWLERQKVVESII